MTANQTLSPEELDALERDMKGGYELSGWATDLVDRLIAQARQPEAPKPLHEVDGRSVCDALGFDPTNHHNALKCPYCNPQGLAFASTEALDWPRATDGPHKIEGSRLSMVRWLSDSKLSDAEAYSACSGHADLFALKAAEEERDRAHAHADAFVDAVQRFGRQAAKIKTLTTERDEALKDVERLKVALANIHLGPPDTLRPGATQDVTRPGFDKALVWAQHIASSALRQTGAE